MSIKDLIITIFDIIFTIIREILENWKLKSKEYLIRNLLIFKILHFWNYLVTKVISWTSIVKILLTSAINIKNFLIKLLNDFNYQ